MTITGCRVFLFGVRRMKVEIELIEDCPCNDHDGYCEAVTDSLIPCCGEDIPDNCPAREGFEIIAKEKK